MPEAAPRRHAVALHRPALAGVSALTLLSDHVFPRHAHDQLGIGVVTQGAQRSWSGIGQVEAEAGDVIMCNPGEMHDGAPLGGAPRGWRMLYLDPWVVERELAEEGIRLPELVRPAARDPVLAGLVLRLFAALVQPVPDALAVEVALLRTLRHAAARHAATPPRRTGTSAAVAAARLALDAAPERPVRLAELAALAGVSRFQLLRGFARELGVTPHAYLVQRRVRLAQRLLAAGETPAGAAARAGFADQSHLTRAFRRQLGVTPGRFRAAVGEVRGRAPHSRTHPPGN